MCLSQSFFICFFFFNDTATTEIYPLSLHDALPISARGRVVHAALAQARRRAGRIVVRITPVSRPAGGAGVRSRSEEHTSELQSRQYLVCRLLLEKKKKKQRQISHTQTSLITSRIDH